MLKRIKSSEPLTLMATHPPCASAIASILACNLTGDVSPHWGDWDFIVLPEFLNLYFFPHLIFRNQLLIKEGAFPSCITVHITKSRFRNCMQRTSWLELWTLRRVGGLLLARGPCSSPTPQRCAASSSWWLVPAHLGWPAWAPTILIVGLGGGRICDVTLWFYFTGSATQLLNHYRI